MVYEQCVLHSKLIFHSPQLSTTSARADDSYRDKLCHCCGHKQAAVTILLNLYAK